MLSDDQLRERAVWFERRLLARCRRLLERVVGGVRSEIGSGDLNGSGEKMARLIEPAEKFLAGPCSRCGGAGTDRRTEAACAKCGGNGY